MVSLREKMMAASKAARHDWISAYLGKGPDMLDQAIADRILALPELDEVRRLDEVRHGKS